jgi:heme oxygenase
MDTSTQAGLASRLKEETQGLHRLAERSGIMADLMSGRISLATYCALLGNLRAIYAALEAGLDQAPVDSRLWRPELRRLPALERDLDRLQAGSRQAASALLPAAAAYVRRLVALTQTDPQLLLAHAYLRYLGDLHGGQMLARRVGRQFGLEGPEGTAFYAFGEPAQVEALKRDFRAGLDALDLTPARADAFVAEACEAFRLHQQLFEELQAGTPGQGL